MTVSTQKMPEKKSATCWTKMECMMFAWWCYQMSRICQCHTGCWGDRKAWSAHPGQQIMVYSIRLCYHMWWIVWKFGLVATNAFQEEAVACACSKPWLHCSTSTKCLHRWCSKRWLHCSTINTCVCTVCSVCICGACCGNVSKLFSWPEHCSRLGQSSIVRLW